MQKREALRTDVERKKKGRREICRAGIVVVVFTMGCVLGTVKLYGIHVSGLSGVG